MTVKNGSNSKARLANSKRNLLSGYLFGVGLVKTPSDLCLCYGQNPTIQVEMNCRQPKG